MADFDPVSFGKRLREELKEQGWGVKRLREKLLARTGAARGTSYGSVWSYVNGEAPAEPHRKVVEAMSDLFGVMPGYLMFGGDRTAADARARQSISAASGAPGPSADDMLEEVMHELWRHAVEFQWGVLRQVGCRAPDPATLAEMPRVLSGGDLLSDKRITDLNMRTTGHWLGPLIELNRRIGDVGPEPIGEALAGPLQALGIRPEDAVSVFYEIERWLEDYITAMMPVLLSLAPELNRQRAITEEDSDDQA